MEHKTPNKSIPIEHAKERRLIGIMPGDRGVEVVYARTCNIDGYIFDVVETEYVVSADLVHLQGGNMAVIQSLFEFALNNVKYSVGEIIRILKLRK